MALAPPRPYSSTTQPAQCRAAAVPGPFAGRQGAPRRVHLLAQFECPPGHRPQSRRPTPCYRDPESVPCGSCREWLPPFAPHGRRREEETRRKTKTFPDSKATCCASLPAPRFQPTRPHQPAHRRSRSTNSASPRLIPSIRFLNVPGNARSRLPKRDSTGGANVWNMHTAFEPALTPSRNACRYPIAPCTPCRRRLRRRPRSSSAATHGSPSQTERRPALSCLPWSPGSTPPVPPGRRRAESLPVRSRGVLRWPPAQEQSYRWSSC